MIGGLARKLFGSSNDRRIRGYTARVAAINAMEQELEALSDEALRARTDAFKAEVAAGKSLDDILVPAFATVREASKRVTTEPSKSLPSATCSIPTRSRTFFIAFATSRGEVPHTAPSQ